MRITVKPFPVFKILMCAVVVTAFGCGNGGLSTVNIKASMDYSGRGHHRPLVQEPIFLLNNSIASPEMEEALKLYLAANPQPVNHVNPRVKSTIGTRGGFIKGDGQRIWNRYVVDKLETHHDGSAKFKNVKAGEYWIYCIKQKPTGEWLIWNVKTTVNFYESINVTINDANVSFR